MSCSLAVHGGEPVRKTPMPFREAFGDAEVEQVMAVVEYYRSRQQDPPYQGYFEKNFCDEFSDFMGGGYTDAVATGTAACYVAVAALNLPPKSEVIISPVTDSGPLNCLILQGLTPVVADSAPNSYNMGVAEFLARVTPNTKAVFAVHAAGEPCEIDLITEEAHKRGIFVVEDCSQAPGAVLNGIKVGGFGDISAFSTMYRKSLAAGASGGLVYTKDEALYHQALAHADRGKQTWRTDIYLNDPGHSLFPAHNFNTDEFSCAVGSASLARLQETVDARVAFLKSFLDALSTASNACSPYAFHEGFSPFYFPVFVDTDKVSCTKNEFAQALQAEGVGLLPDYGCLISTWKWALPYLSDDFVTKNALETRDGSFNFFVNERYGQQEVDDTIAAIQKVEAHYTG